eukprot:685853-Prorocentrum_minimum.AAC.1
MADAYPAMHFGVFAIGGGTVDYTVEMVGSPPQRAATRLVPKRVSTQCNVEPAITIKSATRWKGSRVERSFPPTRSLQAVLPTRVTIPSDAKEVTVEAQTACCGALRHFLLAVDFEMGEEDHNRELRVIVEPTAQAVGSQ